MSLKVPKVSKLSNSCSFVHVLNEFVEMDVHRVQRQNMYLLGRLFKAGRKKFSRVFVGISSLAKIEPPQNYVDAKVIQGGKDPLNGCLILITIPDWLLELKTKPEPHMR